MPYRRLPRRPEKPLPPEPEKPLPPEPEKPLPPEYINIPMPNEKEFSDINSNKKKQRGIPSIFNFFKENIKLEEVILIGLIMLLLDESLQDDFLLILLVYILLF